MSGAGLQPTGYICANIMQGRIGRAVERRDLPHGFAICCL